MNAQIGRLALGLALFVAMGAVSTLRAQSGPHQFYPLSPCRLLDTRVTPPYLSSAQTRGIQVQGRCGVPAGAKAVALNVTVVTPTSGGYLTFWPGGQSQPNASTINFSPQDVLANGAILTLGAGPNDLNVFNGTAGITHLVLDVTGYFQ